MRNDYLWALALLAWPAIAAEHRFDFAEVRENQTPPGFRSAVTGQGKPGDWRVIMDEVPPLLPAISPAAPAVAKKAVLAQLAQDPTDEHFPLLIYEGETIDDFTLTTRFKTVKGVAEQMAGIAFRIQNETNYYVVRASSLGNNLRFYKVLNGERGPLVGPEVPIPSGVWHELTVECKGNAIRCLLNGKELITATDKVNPFLAGRSAFGPSPTQSATSPTPDWCISRTKRRHRRWCVRCSRSIRGCLAFRSMFWATSRKTPRLLASKNTNEVNRAGSKSGAGRDRAGHALLREGKGLRLRGPAAAGPEWGPGRRRARDHEARLPAKRSRMPSREHCRSSGKCRAGSAPCRI